MKLFPTILLSSALVSAAPSMMYVAREETPAVEPVDDVGAPEALPVDTEFPVGASPVEVPPVDTPTEYPVETPVEVPTIDIPTVETPVEAPIKTPADALVETPTQAPPIETPYSPTPILLLSTPTNNNSITTTSSDSTLERVTSWTIPPTCPWTIPWPLPGVPQPTIDDVSIPQLSIYPRPSSVSETLIIQNYCAYPLHIEPHIGNTIGELFSIPAGGSHERAFSATPAGSGVNLKVSKTQGDFSRPLQVEYAVADGTVWYDLSLIDCLGRSADGLRNADTSACAGHEGGLQMGPGGEGVSFQCAAGAWCDDQVYLYEENLCKKSNPNSACKSSEGIAVEFCASGRT